MSTPEGLLPVDVEQLFAPHDAYDVLAITGTQMPFGLDDYIDAVDIAFTLKQRPGVFIYTTPAVLFEQFAPFIGIEATVGIIERIYEIAV